MIVPGSMDHVYGFFAEPSNLERITPPILRFQILERSPGLMFAGMLIKYRLRLFGVPFRWVTKIEEAVDGDRFVDVQLTGPYAMWRHTHTFRSTSEGIVIGDRIEYRMRYGWLGSLAHVLFVRRQIDSIFNYREKAVYSELMRTGELIATREATA